MVRGCQKKIIYLKNTNSAVFDEAYFVINEKALGSDVSECDMIKEANRILDECFCIEEKNNIFFRIITSLKRNIVPFLVGMFFTTIIVLIIK